MYTYVCASMLMCISCRVVRHLPVYVRIDRYPMIMFVPYSVQDVPKLFLWLHNLLMPSHTLTTVLSLRV